MGKVTDIYGELTFNRKVMQQKLSKTVYEKLIASIQKGDLLDESIASDVAHAMKEWAIEKGATHFTHWFQPQRCGTAEKHDAFITYDKDGEMIERFSDMQLIQSEPDASSFPSGGMRSTFEARGYTVWDPTSPAFLYEANKSRTLVIPSVFLSWTGEVLDVKTPFLRSQHALNDSAIALQKLLGNRAAKRIKVYAGPEQEYFLIPKRLYETRPDLKVCNRTLFGAPPAKGQQMDDHYFGSIKNQVLIFMEDFDLELYRRGIPAKTRHNEVAPNQFEIAPLYEVANLSIDHNLQLVDIMKQVADRHDLVCLVHEKPFDGINGSGKHVNWSLGDNTGANYLEPSASPLKNISFLMALGAVMVGVDKFGGLLRAAIADAGNDHRLGANEAPPAIMSIYLGDHLSNILDEIEGLGAITDKKIAHINLGVRNLPKMAKDTSDRNRTSPIAFTGNKFEFRAVGSSHNCSESITVLNLIVAYGYDVLTERLKKLAKGDAKSNAIAVLKDIIKETKRVRFDGNNYSAEWLEEAAKRKLPNAKNTPEALPFYVEKPTIDLYKKYNVLTEAELHSKVDIKLEGYINIKEIELLTAVNITNTMIIPALTEHLGNVASTAGAVIAAGVKSDLLTKEVKSFEGLYGDIKKGVVGLEAILNTKEDDLLKLAKIYAVQGEEALLKLRVAVDKTEALVADELWPLAKYQELITDLS